MKKIMIIVVALFLIIPNFGWAEDKVVILKATCPETTMQDSCLICHVAGDFRVKETAPDAHLIYPNDSMKIFDGEGYFLLGNIDSTSIKEYFDYLHKHSIKKAVIEIHSSGGSLFDSQRIVNMIQYWQSRGVSVETRLFGAAFSAGFYIFVSGNNRLVSPNADLMWHELQSASFGLNVTTPADREEEAKILRHIQNIRNSYIATRGKLTKEQIDEKISKKEFWMSGTQSVEYGFADGFLGK